jgi:hypothetical protein
MVRTQIQLTEKQAAMLKDLAARRGESMAELIRQSIDLLFGQAGERPHEELRRRAAAIADSFRSGRSDIATHHDDYFAEDLKR